MVLKKVLLIMCMASPVYADTGFTSTIRVSETDNAPACTVGQVKVSPGTLSCAGQIATITTGGSGGGGSFITDATSYIQNRSTLQTGATAYPEYIYASSASVNTLSVGDSSTNDGKSTFYIPSIFARVQFYRQGNQLTMRFNDSALDAVRGIGQIDSIELRIMNNGTVMAQYVNGGLSLGPFDINYVGSPLLSVQGTMRTPVFNTTTTSATVTGSDGLVVGNLTAGRCVQTDTGGLLTAAAGACATGGTPGTPVNSVQVNVAGAFGGDANFNWSGSSLTVNANVRTSTLTILSETTTSGNAAANRGLLDIYHGNATAAGTTVLMSFGSNQQADQVVVRDQAPFDLIRYGGNLGGLRVGRVGVNSQIYSDQATTQLVNWWNSGAMELKTATSGNGGKQIIFYPQQVEAMRISNTEGVVIKTSATIYGAGGITTPNLAFGVASVTGNYTASSTATVILADATNGSLTVTLPTAVGLTGRMYKVKRLNIGVNTVTVATTGGQTIDGSATTVLTVQYTSVDFVSDGVGWNIT